MFCVDQWKIRSWFIEAQKLTRKDSNTPCHFLEHLHMNNSKILVQLGISLTEVWDFGAPGSPSIQLSEISLDKPQLNIIDI